MPDTVLGENPAFDNIRLHPPHDDAPAVTHRHSLGSRLRRSMMGQPILISARCMACRADYAVEIFYRPQTSSGWTHIR